jgi:hypothetical protein
MIVRLCGPLAQAFNKFYATRNIRKLEDTVRRRNSSDVSEARCTLIECRACLLLLLLLLFAFDEYIFFNEGI